MLKIHEYIAPDGSLASVSLRAEADALWLVGEDGELPLPPGSLQAVMLRYGAPFDEQAQSQRCAELELARGARLVHVRHLAGYDVVAKDYLVYSEPELTPVCVMATNVAGALRHLALALRRGLVSQGQDPA
ncbi:MAG TPA: hypothetical protein VHB79_21400 [Polyangiaceae bacterium]|nr:hypothetical protein [Polyangiaceae bacterium]